MDGRDAKREVDLRARGRRHCGWPNLGRWFRVEQGRTCLQLEGARHWTQTVWDRGGSASILSGPSVDCIASGRLRNDSSKALAAKPEMEMHSLGIYWERDGRPLWTWKLGAAAV